MDKVNKIALGLMVPVILALAAWVWATQIQLVNINHHLNAHVGFEKRHTQCFRLHISQHNTINNMREAMDMPIIPWDASEESLKKTQLN